MNILLTAILLINILLLAVFCGVIIKLRGVYRDITTQTDEKTPSLFTQWIMTIADNFSRSLIAQAKATFMGKQSGEARAEKGIDADLAEDSLNLINPGLGAILNSFPALRKTLRRNPALIDLALSKLSGKISAGAGAPARQVFTPSNGQTNFKI